MDHSFFKYDDFFKKAFLFESSLILLAIILGWIAGINPFKTIQLSETALLYGVLGTVPLFLMFMGMQKLQAQSVNTIRELLLKTLGPGLNRYDWTDLLLLGAIAGLSEELVFRGVIQPWLENAWGYSVGLLVSSVLFGVVHAMTPLYALLATLVGIYLGLSMDYGDGRNLLTPILIHGLYDFLAFLMLMRAYRASLAGTNPPTIS
ncbi:hypothetical protein JCM14076_27500 [Methylosoma difficile]